MSGFDSLQFRDKYDLFYKRPQEVKKIDLPARSPGDAPTDAKILEINQLQNKIEKLTSDRNISLNTLSAELKYILEDGLFIFERLKTLDPSSILNTRPDLFLGNSTLVFPHPDREHEEHELEARKKEATAQRAVLDSKLKKWLTKIDQMESIDSRQDTLLYRLQVNDTSHKTSATGGKRKANQPSACQKHVGGYRCSGWNVCGEITNELILNHMNGEKVPTPMISVSESPSRLMSFVRPVITNRDSDATWIEVISLTMLQRLGVLHVRSTDLCHGRGIPLSYEKRPGHAQFVTDTHWVLMHWIPDEAIVATLAVDEFLELARDHGVIDRGFQKKLLDTRHEVRFRISDFKKFPLALQAAANKMDAAPKSTKIPDVSSNNTQGVKTATSRYSSVPVKHQNVSYNTTKVSSGIDSTQSSTSTTSASSYEMAEKTAEEADWYMRVSELSDAIDKLDTRRTELTNSPSLLNNERLRLNADRVHLLDRFVILSKELSEQSRRDKSAQHIPTTFRRLNQALKLQQLSSKIGSGIPPNAADPQRPGQISAASEPSNQSKNTSAPPASSNSNAPTGLSTETTLKPLFSFLNTPASISTPKSTSTPPKSSLEHGPLIFGIPTTIPPTHSNVTPIPASTPIFGMVEAKDGVSPTLSSFASLAESSKKSVDVLAPGTGGQTTEKTQPANSTTKKQTSGSKTTSTHDTQINAPMTDNGPTNDGISSATNKSGPVFQYQGEVSTSGLTPRSQTPLFASPGDDIGETSTGSGNAGTSATTTIEHISRPLGGPPAPFQPGYLGTDTSNTTDNPKSTPYAISFGSKTASGEIRSTPRVNEKLPSSTATLADRTVSHEAGADEENGSTSKDTSFAVSGLKATTKGSEDDTNDAGSNIRSKAPPTNVSGSGTTSKESGKDSGGISGKENDTPSASKPSINSFGTSTSSQDGGTSGKGLFGGATTSSSIPTPHSLFGGRSSSKGRESGGKGLFGGTTNTSIPTSQGGLFGAHAPNKDSGASGKGLFGGATNTPSMPTSSGGLFGTSISNNHDGAAGKGLFGGATNNTNTPIPHVSLFGASATSKDATDGATSKENSFLSSVKSTGLFGGQASEENGDKASESTPTSSPFGSMKGNPSTRSLFGTEPKDTPSPSLFGARAPTNTFGSSAATQSSSSVTPSPQLFGFAKAEASAAAGFGAAPSSTGKAAAPEWGSRSTSSAFGSSGLFGSATAVPGVNTGFGATTSAASTSQAAAFGSSSTSSAFGSSGLFRSASTGQATNAGFGAGVASTDTPSPSRFGSSNTSNAFGSSGLFRSVSTGQGTATGFGTTASSTSTPTPSLFGSGSTSTRLSAAGNPSFASAISAQGSNAGFGAATTSTPATTGSVFGARNTSSGFGTPTTAQGLFGSSRESTKGGGNGFGSSSPFGGSSAFGAGVSGAQSKVGGTGFGSDSGSGSGGLTSEIDTPGETSKQAPPSPMLDGSHKSAQSSKDGPAPSIFANMESANDPAQSSSSIFGIPPRESKDSSAGFSFGTIGTANTATGLKTGAKTTSSLFAGLRSGSAPSSTVPVGANTLGKTQPASQTSTSTPAGPVWSVFGPPPSVGTTSESGNEPILNDKPAGTLFSFAPPPAAEGGKAEQDGNKGLFSFAPIPQAEVIKAGQDGESCKQQ